MSVLLNDSEDVFAYSQRLFACDDKVLKAVREKAQKQDLNNIQIDATEGRILQLLIKAIGARKIIEIGTFFGYSAISMARAISPSGKLISLEHDADHKRIAEKFILQARLQELIEVRLGDARELLPAVEREGPFDLCFIDANWMDYPHYLDWALRNVRIGGLIIGHNAHYFGFVGVDPEADEFEARLTDVSQEAAEEYLGLDQESKMDFKASLACIREFNHRMSSDSRLLSAMLPTNEGLVAGLVITA